MNLTNDRIVGTIGTKAFRGRVDDDHRYQIILDDHSLMDRR